MSSEEDLRRLQSETWPDMNAWDQQNMNVHRTIRLEVPLHASGALKEASRILRGLADNIDRTYALQSQNLSERTLLWQMMDYLWGAQAGLNALCPWRREHKKRMQRILKGENVPDNTVPLRQHKR